jgi:hypothetical protein
MKYNQDFSGIAVADEIINRASSTAAALVHDTILDDSSIEIWTGAGGTGTQLTEGTDFELDDLDATLTAEAGSDIYLSLAIINGTYHSTDLYVSYKTVGDFNDAGDINAITGSVTVSADYTVGGEQSVNVTAATADITIPEGLAIGTRKTIRKLHITTSSSVNVLSSGSEVFTSESLTTMPIYQNENYQMMCAENGFTTPKGYIKTTAETTYAYLTKQPKFKEEHMGLHDALIETEILQHALLLGGNKQETRTPFIKALA